MKTILKNNILLLLLDIIISFLCVCFAITILPLQRNNYASISIIFIVLYALTFIASIILSWVLFAKIKRTDSLEQKTKEKFALIFYFSTMLIVSLVITIIFLILRAVNPNSFLLTQGILSFVLTILFFVILIIPIEINVKFIS